MQNIQCTFAKFRRNRPQRRDKVDQKAGRVTISFIQRQPGGGHPTTVDPFADQRGFAKPGRGRNEGQFTTLRETLVQPLKQASTDDHFRRRGRDIEFRGKNRRGCNHEAIIVCPGHTPYVICYELLSNSKIRRVCDREGHSTYSPFTAWTL